MRYNLYIQKYMQTIQDPGRIKAYFIYTTLVAFLISLVINQSMKEFIEVPFFSVLLTSLIYSYSITTWVHLLISIHFSFCTRSCLSAKEKMENQSCYNIRDIARAAIFILLTQIGVIIGTLQVYFIKKFLGAQLFRHHPKAEDFCFEHFLNVLGFSLAVSIIILIGAFFYERLRLRYEYTIEMLKENEIQKIELKRLKTQAELSALQAKINPHFLFNTLNSIASLITIDPPRAERAIEKLSRLFRLTLNHSLKKDVHIEESLKTVESYLELEQIRLGSRLKYNINIQGDISDSYIPGLLIQPIVENSIKYGITPSVEGGYVDINVHVDGNQQEYCHIAVKNSGAPWSEQVSESGHGLENIQERLRLLYDQDWKLEIEKTSPVTVKIKIPHHSKMESKKDV